LSLHGTANQSLNADICLLYPTSTMSVYQGRMIARIFSFRPLLRATSAVALLGFGLAGCASMSDSMTAAFADPAKFDMYDCKQLEAERTKLATRAAELQRLMAKADTGVAGPVVSELAYRNEYIAVRGQTGVADDVWRRNKCVATAAALAGPAPPENAKGERPRMRSGSAVY
jgi:hypothetical protein